MFDETNLLLSENGVNIALDNILRQIANIGREWRLSRHWLWLATPTVTSPAIAHIVVRF